jgi:CheY-like chemotaxis protein
VLLLPADADALAAFHHWQPDGLILDVANPYGAALSACRKIKTDPDSWSVPALVLCARVDPVTLEAAGRAGAEELMSKPFSCNALLDTVQRLVGWPAPPQPASPRPEPQS